jgi:hypothetical protein
MFESWCYAKLALVMLAVGVANGLDPGLPKESAAEERWPIPISTIESSTINAVTGSKQ